MKCILGAYSHIHYGSSNASYEVLLEKQVKPLLTMLYKNPEIHFVLRLGLNFFEWLENVHPEFNMLIYDLCQKKQLELLCSPAYDAILSLIPIMERSVYIEKTASYLRKRFSKKIQGYFSSYQIFNPSFLGSISLSGIDYVIISTYNQNENKVFGNRPFYMNELGKICYIFPIDDVLACDITNYIKSKEPDDKFLSSIEKSIPERSNYFRTLMVSLDQICNINNSVEIFNIMFDKLRNQSVLPSDYIKDKAIINQNYLPSGFYGRENFFKQYSSINELIIENPMYTRNFLTFNFLRESTKELKKRSDLKKQLDALFVKAGCGSVYVSDVCSSGSEHLFSNKHLCNIEQILVHDKDFEMPVRADITGDRLPEEIIVRDGSVAYVNLLGGTVERYTVFDFLYDFTFCSGCGIFSEILKSKDGKKTVSLSSKLFEIQTLDRKNGEITLFLPKIEINKSKITNYYKHYKFGKSSISLDVVFEDENSNIDKNYFYETCLDLNLGTDTVLKNKNMDKDGIHFESDMIILENLNIGYKMLIKLSKSADINIRAIKNTSGNYKYHQIKLSYSIEKMLKASEKVTITLALYKI